MTRRLKVTLVLFSITSLTLLAVSGVASEWLSGIKWNEPAVVTPGENGSAPSDATVLFDGKDLSAWKNGENWEVKEGAAICHKSDVETKEAFGDCQLHIEWMIPEGTPGKGQGRGNSGVYFMKTYEIQILDSYKNETYFDGQAASIYKQTPPMVNAMRKQGEWNVYDLVFTAPRFSNDGKLKSPAYITAIHNGVLVLNHFELQGASFWHQPPKYTKHAEKLPISLQNHGNPVHFRNIWVREIAQPVGKRIAEPRNR